MGKATVGVSLGKVNFNLSQLAIEESVRVKRIVDGKKKRVRYSIPVSIFRDKDFFSKKTGEITRGVGGEAAAAVGKAYKSALTGVAASHTKSARRDRGVSPSMKWPGPRGRSPSTPVVMRTSYGDSSVVDAPDSSFSFKGYTSNTLRKYRSYFKYLYEVTGLRDYVRSERAFGLISKQSKRTRPKFAFEALETTSARLQTMIGKGSPGENAATSLKARDLKSQKLGKNGRLPARFRQVKVPGSEVKAVAPVATFTGTITGFDKAVSDFTQREALFIFPFVTGDVKSLSNSINFPASGVARTAAIVTKNEFERPYIRKFMGAMHKIMKDYVIRDLRRRRKRDK